jgi:anti-sigma factor RsiW
MDCRRAEELLSDHLDGALHPLRARDLEAHLQGCDRCRALHAAVAEVMTTLRSFPVLEPAADLAERAASAALRAPRRPRVVGPVRAPAWLQVAAAAMAMAISGGVLYAIESPAPARTAARLLDRTANAGVYLLERKDRLVEDVRLLRVVISTAFEGRLDRMNDRVDDYRRLLEKRRANEESQKEGRQGAGAPRGPLVAARPGFRTTNEGRS